MLRSLLSVIRFETGKAIRARITWVTLLLPSIVAALSVWADSVTRRVQSAIGDGAELVPSAYLSFTKGAGSGLVLGGIMLLLYSSMIMANEGHWRTFKVIMLRPHRRWIWMVGKFKVLCWVGFAMAALVALTSLAAGAIVGDYTDIAEEGYVIFEAKFLMTESLKAFGLVAPPLLALAAFGLMFSTFTDHTGIAASATLGAYIVMETAKEGMRDGQKYLFNTFMPSLLDTSYFKEVKGFADGMSDSGWDQALFQYNIISPLAAAAVFFIIACIVFQRRDFLN